MNRYLAVLMPVQEPVELFGDDGTIKTARVIPADRARQSPRIYTALASGGGVLFDPEVATAMKANGFTVASFAPTEAETAYLAVFDARFKTTPLFLATCDGRVVTEASGIRRCVPVAGLKTIPQAEAKSMGLITPADLAKARAWVKGAVIGKVFTTDRKPTAEEEAAARKTVELRTQIAKQITDLTMRVAMSGRKLSPQQEAAFGRALAWLSATAQPTAVAEKAWAAASASAKAATEEATSVREKATVAAKSAASRTAELARGFQRALKSAASQLPGASSSTATFGVAPAVVVGAVVVVVVAAAIIYLAYQQGQAVNIQAELHHAFMENTEELRRCIANPHLPREQRRACEEALAQLQPPEQPKQWWESLEGAAPYIAGVAALGVGVIYLGPLARQASRAGAEAVARGRQRLAQRG